jgi:protein-S-isoprenylcysteine O-methyltransferase Ste14
MSDRHTRQNPEDRGRRALLLPRWAIPLVWAVLVLAVQVLLPWAVAQLGPRLGWLDGAPATWSWIGLALVALGIGCYGWCLAAHFASYTAPVRVGLTPPHLIRGGPYGFSRNPMYVSGLLTWLGWTVFFGSPAVGLGLVLLWAAFTWRVIPREERQLEALFGDVYLDYKLCVPRWLGRA